MGCIITLLKRELTMFHMVRAVPRMATMRAASLKAQTIMAARMKERRARETHLVGSLDCN